jgi:vacuolar protein sorting-associated protein 45
VKEILIDPTINKLEKLRLVMLYSLRYENDDRVETLKGYLKDSLISTDMIELVDVLLAYAGKKVRKTDLFSNRSFFAKARDTFKKALKV